MAGIGGHHATPESASELALYGAQSGNRTHDLRITSEIQTVRMVSISAI